MGLRGRPTIETLGAMGLGFLVQQLLIALGSPLSLVLAPTFLDHPWTVVTSVYAHGGLGHLFANALALAIVGPLVARRTTRLSFHVFFVLTGALAGISEVVLGGLIGPPTGVLGASGAIFALLGYLLSGNVVSALVLDRIALSGRVQLLVFLAVAVLLTVATAGPGVALFGHATGLLCGLLAGRGRLIDAPNRPDDRPRRGHESGRL